MNKVLSRIVTRVLLAPKVKRQFEKIGEFYRMYPWRRFHQEILELQIWTSLVCYPCMLPLFEVGQIVPLEERDAKPLEAVTRMVSREGMNVVEVGSWTGRSTSVLARTAADYHGSVFPVDHWMGNEEIWRYEIATIEH